MEENKLVMPETHMKNDESKATEAKLEESEAIQKAKETLEEIRKKALEAQEAMKEGKGVFTLERPFKCGDREITELAYDFLKLTGIEYTDAMDSDTNAGASYKITYRQGLALFAAAAAKETPGPDAQDIISKIGVTDAVECVQLATLFFNASARAGRLRIAKK